MTELGLIRGLAVWLKVAAVPSRVWAPLFPGHRQSDCRAGVEVRVSDHLLWG